MILNKIRLLLTWSEKIVDYLKNPFNYIGGKYKLLPQILPLFPEHISTFVDVFGGGGDISFNIQADKIIYNDKCKPLVNIFRCMQSHKDFVERVENIISQYGLSKTNKQGFLDLRTDYNNKPLSERVEFGEMLYCLLTHAFNYQIAFNSKGEYNMPSGYNRSWLSPQLKQRLIKYIERLNEINIEFHSEDFHNLNLTECNTDDFYYFDPPYLITVGAYEKDYFCKWSEDYEKELLNTLDILDLKGCKFALSNVLTHKGKTNEILNKWCQNYNVHHLSMNYKNCNYQTNSRDIKSSDEVLITNY